MELPQKVKQPEERMMNGVLVVSHLSPTELKINEILEYLESQKEGEEPKQIDVAALVHEHAQITLHQYKYNSTIGTERLQEIINTLKALQQ